MSRKRSTNVVSCSPCARYVAPCSLPGMARRFFTINGAKVRELRERLGIDQPTLAATIGCSQPYMSQIESGIRNPNPKLTLDIANALGVEFGDITERVAS